MNTKPSAWQEKITGEWYGCPSVFDEEGRHLGFDQVTRSSVFEGGRTTYYMTTALEVTGPLRARFEATGFAFGVEDQGRDRIYLGPDFYGAGQPQGSLVDAHYYAPGWSADLRTMVHVLEDGRTQVYSSQLFEGPRLIAVFNGLYLMATDYASNPDTKARIERFIAEERRRGNTPYILPMKVAGEWHGEFQVYDARQSLLGTTQVRMTYRPLDLRRAEVRLTMEGACDFRATFVRAREGYRHDFQGPDLFGTGRAYGRALYTSAHVRGRPMTFQARDVLIDDQGTQSCVWKLGESGHTAKTLYGVLRWQEAETVLKAVQTP